MRMGAFDYISKPPDLNRLLNTVRIALDHTQLAQENKQLKKKVSKQFEMIGKSEELEQIKSMIDKVAPTEARVLITGENGTGKELVAHWLHEKSERNKGPFIEVNCAAIPSELIESELFGHVKGAFTSANKDRAGKFEAANGGTIFLDEIGDMSLSAQAKVLRALQENRVQRVGSDKDIKVDVRVVAATNKNLKDEITDKRFREDLYHRLAVILIHVPSLKERRRDIPELIQHFTEKIAREQGTKPKSFDDKAISILEQLDWTGNIRELRNVVERLIILGDQQISDKDVEQFVQLKST
jgi:DNA-binding NtrC family response regulator